MQKRGIVQTSEGTRVRTGGFLSSDGGRGVGNCMKEERGCKIGKEGSE